MTNRRTMPPITPKVLGITVSLVLVGATLATFGLSRISTVVGSGDTIEAEFARGFKLDDYHSSVRMADVKVGKVESVEPTDHGTVVVKMKIDHEAHDMLGAQPTASIQPTTLLGGIYYVDLAPGNTRQAYDGAQIPVARTSIPVELGQVLTAVTVPAQAALKSDVARLDKTLKPGTPAIRRFVRDAPAALRPTAAVLEALRGTDPRNDLTDLVSGLQVAAYEMTKTDGQLDGIFVDLDKSTAALADRRAPLATSIASMPQTLRTTRVGLTRLDGSLDRLTSTARRLQPTARQLGPLLSQLDPVLVRARPVVNDARRLVADARPMVQQLVPAAADASAVMDNVEGPVIERINGKIKELVLSPWKGVGPYAGGGNDNLFYEEVGYLGVNGAKSFQTHDGNGAQGRLMAGISAQTLGGANVPMSIEQYLELLGLHNPPGPQPDNELVPSFLFPEGVGR